MLLKVSIILSVTAIVSLIIYSLCASKRRKKSHKFARRLFGAITVLCMLAAVVIFIIYCKSNNIKLFNKLKEYDPVTTYKEVLENDGEQAAVSLLPDGVFAQGENVYIKNEKGDLFAIEKNYIGAVTGSEPTELKVDGYYAKTIYNGAEFVCGDKTLRAIINSENELVLDGYLQYSVYDGGKLEYKNKVIANDVVYCQTTNNSLLYVTTDGKLYGLGFNEYGQLGDTTTKNKATPTFIADNISRFSISDTHSMTVDEFGILNAVGDNSYSQLGNKTAISAQEPTKIMQGIKDVKVGNYLSVVLAVNGELFTAGNNDFGQLGNGGEAFKAELISIMKGVKKIDVNGNTVAALTFEGDLYVWGDNKGFKAGYEKEGNIPSPVKIKSEVFDFTLSDTGVFVITNTRDIEKSESGKFEKVLEFGAKLPAEPDENGTINDQSKPDAA